MSTDQNAIKTNPKDEDRYDNDFVHHVVKSLRPMLEQCVVPVFVRQGERFAQHGTGTLLRVADRSFLLTAAHVVNQADELQIPLYIADSEPGARFQRIGGRRSFLRDPRVDVSVLELPCESLAQLANRRFLRLADMDFQDCDRHGLFLIVGYPCEWNQPDLTSQTVSPSYLGYMTCTYEGELRNRSYDPCVHLLLSAKKESSRPLDTSQAKLPGKLSGISGAAIWKICSENHLPSEWEPDRVRIIAIETSVYGDAHEIIRGTHIGAILRVLWDAYPNLRRVLQLYLPDMQWGNDSRT